MCYKDATKPTLLVRDPRPWVDWGRGPRVPHDRRGPAEAGRVAPRATAGSGTSLMLRGVVAAIVGAADGLQL